MIALIFLSACAHEAPRPELRQQPLPPGAFDAELSNYNYPREVKFYDFRSQGQVLRMAYVLAEAPVPNGQTVVLFHGKNFSAAFWEPTIKELTRRGYRVVAPDQIGFGKSSKPAAYQFSFQALAENTKALLDSLAIPKVSVVGHSMGGMLAVRYCLQYPRDVTKLALVNPLGLEDWKLSVPYRGLEESYRSELKATPEALREYQRLNYFGGTWSESYAPLVEMLAGWTRHPDYPKVAWNNALTADMIFTQPVLYEFGALKLPTLLLIGQRDRTAIGKGWAPKGVAEALGDYPRLGREAAKKIPGAKLVEFKNSGHLPQVEEFSRYLAELATFLKE